MKPKLLLCLALVLSGGLIAAPAQQPDLASTDGLQWGETVDGFQMTAILDKTNGIVHCRIRNTTTNEMDYPSSDFGYIENVHLEIQDSTNWTGFGAMLFPFPQGARNADRYYTKKIEPGKIVINDYGILPVHTREEYLKMCHGNTNEALHMEQFDQWLADTEATCQNDTFAFDLIEADWPTNVFGHTAVKIRAVQSFRAGSNYGYQNRVIHSQELSLDSFLIQSFINQKDKWRGI